ncbi:MAG TPA: sugar phosphate isomerase/epimerase family protein [Sedimentisphaerales bacterium]|nr:sugar phosphate isomerase/epimerase family protein [Sedimentisphaerales bacterium]HRS10005.1 sugar phosphate isomerase/epimerase family protein [Sedimentisphaerales bacterium]HRV46711.1 sugar phosphate isomerase/epimerase family protein [Sedimentisphaerales bacterium]
MQKRIIAASIACLLCIGTSFAQKTPTGNPSDFKIKTCLHSVSYAGVWRGQAKLTVDEFLVKAKELGYDGVMLMAKRPHVSPLDYDEAARRALRRRIEELGLELVCLAGYTDFTAGSDKLSIPNVEIQAAYVGELARLARDLGTDVVRVFTGYERPDIPYDRQYATVVEGLRLAGKEAAKYGVTLAVQNHHDIGAHHDTMFWLLNEVNLPNVKAAYDPWTPTLQGLSAEELRASVRKMAPYMIHTTAADYVRQARYLYSSNLTNFLEQDAVLRAVPLGEGIIDYKTFFGALKEIGYQGYIAYEMCEVLDGGGDIENLDRTAKESLAYIKSMGE